MKLDFEDDNVEHVSMTLAQVRDDELDLSQFDELTTALDNAQSHVFSGDHKVAYVVITISKE